MIPGRSRSRRRGKAGDSKIQHRCPAVSCILHRSGLPSSAGASGDRSACHSGGAKREKDAERMRAGELGTYVTGAQNMDAMTVSATSVPLATKYVRILVTTV